MEDIFTPLEYFRSILKLGMMQTAAKLFRETWIFVPIGIAINLLFGPSIIKLGSIGAATLSEKHIIMLILFTGMWNKFFHDKHHFQL